ncbi:MAG: XdhC/CoxI family protein [Caldilineales bacterium]
MPPCNGQPNHERRTARHPDLARRRPTHRHRDRSRYLGFRPRPVGAKIAATGDGRFSGSVSAGCVEGAVLEQCAGVIQSGQPRLLTFGVADEEAWGVGLACGGTIRVYVEPFSAWEPVFASLVERLEANKPLAIVTALDGPAGKLLVAPDGQTVGPLDLGSHTAAAVSAAQEKLNSGRGGTVQLSDGRTVFVEVYPKVARLIIVGAVHIAVPLIDLARTLGYYTIIVDPRQAFATRERFPRADEIVNGWPEDVLPGMELDDSAHIVVLTHDPKIDDPAMQASLPSAARYVGALGSRRTNQQRRERLLAAGISQETLARLHAPIGLPLGGRSPEEIALSILAEIVQVRNKKD